MAGLYDLPDEIIVYILSFLTSRQQVVTIPGVCHRFKELVSTQWYWRTRYVQLCGAQPLTELPSIRLWQQGCVQQEFALITTITPQNSTTLKGAVGGIDCVHILNSDLHGASTVVAAGSRNSSVYIWRKRSSTENVTSPTNGRKMRDYTMATLAGHSGWVWSLASERDFRAQLLCSGSWDHNIRVWDISVGECVTNIRQYHKAAVLSLHIPYRDCLVSGCFDKKVRVIDLRLPFPVKSEHKLHKKSVLSVAASEHYIYSGSEDNSVCVWDRRNEKMLERVMLPGIVPSLHLNSGMLSVATSCNMRVSEEEVESRSHQVHLYDCSQGQLQHITCLDTGHSQPITSVLHGRGILATGSKDGSVRLHALSSPFSLLSQLEQQSNAITALDFNRNCLAVAGGAGDRTVTVWVEPNS